MKTMKKIFGGILTVAIMLNSVATLSFADSEIAISAEKANPGYPVSVTVNGTPLTDDTDNNVEWYVCDSIDGTYAKIEGAVGTNWQITNACANKFIKAGIESGLSNAISVGAKASNPAIAAQNPLTGIVETTPAENMFKVEGSDVPFILLDSEEYEGENLILTAKEMMRAKFSSTGTDLKFDPSSTASVAYYMNTELLGKDKVSDMTKDGTIVSNNGGYYAAYPSNIKKYINTDHTWLTEAGNASSNIPNDYTFKAGLALLSRTELTKYASKIGYNTFGNKMWLRTSLSQNSNRILYFGSGGWSSKANKLVWTAPNSDAYQVFPAFYLKDDFFRNEKIDIANTGANVLNMLKANYTISELANTGYSVEELKAIGFTAADEVGVPSATELKISVPIAKPGYSATATYKYVSDVAPGTTTYEWQVSDTIDGEYITVETTDVESFVISNACGNKYLRVRIIPADIHGNFSMFSEYATPSVKIDSALGFQSVLPENSSIPETAGDYSFKFNGTTYQMLDATVDSNKNASFFVFKSDPTIWGAFSLDSSLKFDVNNPNNIGYWLNKELLLKNTPEIPKESGDEYYNLIATNLNSPLDSSVRTNIDKNHVWLTEATTSDGDDYTFTAGIVLLSQSEYKQYASRIGNSSGLKTRTRTTRFDGTNYRNLYVNTKGTTSTYQLNGIDTRICIAFYLNDDFFVNNKVAPSDMGAEVKNFIVNNISRDTMKNGNAGYTEEELAAIGYAESSAYADDVTIVGKISVGQKVAAKYIFNDNGLGKAEDTAGTTYEWYVSDTENGVYNKVDNDEETYVIPSSAQGKYIKVVVSPITSDGKSCVPGSYIVGPVSEKENVTVVLKSVVKEQNATTATYNVEYKDPDTDFASLILAAYDSDGAMVTVTINPYVESGEQSVVLEGDWRNYTVKAMAWDDVECLTPLTIQESF